MSRSARLQAVPQKSVVPRLRPDPLPFQRDLYPINKRASIKAHIPAHLFLCLSILLGNGSRHPLVVLRRDLG